MQIAADRSNDNRAIFPFFIGASTTSIIHAGFIRESKTRGVRQKERDDTQTVKAARVVAVSFVVIHSTVAASDFFRLLRLARNLRRGPPRPFPHFSAPGDDDVDARDVTQSACFAPLAFARCVNI